LLRLTFFQKKANFKQATLNRITMKKAILLFSVIAILSSCSATKKTAEVKKPVESVATVADGSSFEKAVVVAATNEREGIRAEYAWLDKKYPGNKRGGQSLSYHDKKPYDIIKITTADGKSVETYFDISNFFGKF
jgi:hypothetical protein